MFRCRWGLVVVAGLVAGRWTTGMADEPLSPYGGAGSGSTARPPDGNQQNVISPATQRPQGRLARSPAVPQRRPRPPAEPLPQPQVGPGRRVAGIPNTGAARRAAPIPAAQSRPGNAGGG